MDRSFVALLLVLLPGCFLARTAVNAPITPEHIARLEAGRTTQAEVLEILGAPADVVQLGKRSAWRYSHSVQKRTGFTVIVVTLINEDYQEDRAWLFFDENGTLSAAGSTLTAESAVYELPWSDSHEVE